MSKNIRLKASFYTNSLGNEPVRVWLKGLDAHDRKTIGEDIAYVQFKWPIGKPRVDHLRGDIWEVRSQIGNRIARTLFAVVKGEMVLLNGFIKKTQQTDRSEIEIAQTRLKEWIKNENK